MKNINSIVNEMPQSGIRLIKNIADQRHDSIHLEIGQPDFQVAPHIRQAAVDAISNGLAGYCPNNGMQSTRQACVERLNLDYGINAHIDETTITVGAMGGLFNSLLAVINPDDEILVPDPGYPNYISTIRMVRGCPIPYDLVMDDKSGVQLDMDSLIKKITKRTKAIIINSPSNPTGWVAKSSEIQTLLNLAEKHGIFIISDESYNSYVYNENGHVSPLQFSREENIIGVYSCSKTYAIPGWRIGYTITSSKIASLFAKIQEGYCSSTSVISQKAAQIALQSSQEHVRRMKETYHERVLKTISLCNNLGIQAIRPDGAFYIMIRIPQAITINSEEVAIELATQIGVATAPGTTFGKNGKGFLRISLCKEFPMIEEGITRIGDWFKLKSL